MKNKSNTINSFINNIFLGASAIVIVIYLRSCANQILSGFINAFLASNKALLSLIGWGRCARQSNLSIINNKNSLFNGLNSVQRRKLHVSSFSFVPAEGLKNKLCQIVKPMRPNLTREVLKQAKVRNTGVVGNKISSRSPEFQMKQHDRYGVSKWNKKTFNKNNFDLSRDSNHVIAENLDKAKRGEGVAILKSQPSDSKSHPVAFPSNIKLSVTIMQPPKTLQELPEFERKICELEGDDPVTNYVKHGLFHKHIPGTMGPETDTFITVPNGTEDSAESLKTLAVDVIKNKDVAVLSGEELAKVNFDLSKVPQFPVDGKIAQTIQVSAYYALENQTLEGVKTICELSRSEGNINSNVNYKTPSHEVNSERDGVEKSMHTAVGVTFKPKVKVDLNFEKNAPYLDATFVEAGGSIGVLQVKNTQDSKSYHFYEDPSMIVISPTNTYSGDNVIKTNVKEGTISLVDADAFAKAKYLNGLVKDARKVASAIEFASQQTARTGVPHNVHYCNNKSSSESASITELRAEKNGVTLSKEELDNQGITLESDEDPLTGKLTKTYSGGIPGQSTKLGTYTTTIDTKAGQNIQNPNVSSGMTIIDFFKIFLPTTK